LKRPQKEFDWQMTRGERFACWGYLPVHIFVLPLLFSLLITYAGVGLSEIDANLIYYFIGFFFCVICMRKFLRHSFDAMLDTGLRFFGMLFSAYLIYIALVYVLSLVYLLVGDFSGPNQEFVETMASSDFNRTLAMAVFLGPLVEEVLFRGLIFGSIRRKSRAAAYIVSAVLFSFYHIWQFLLVAPDVSVLISAISYLPPAIALAYAYDRSGSIWCSTFLHMIINLLAMFATTAA